MLDEAAISAIASAVAGAGCASYDGHQVVVARNRSLDLAVVTGLGSFLGAAAARAAGLRVIPLSAELGDAAARCAPAVSVAMLLAQAMSEAGPPAAPFELSTAASSSEARSTDELRSGHGERASGAPDTVVKVGGGALVSLEDFDAVLTAIDNAVDCQLLVVPGGGPFADTVRDADRRVGLQADAAHWMAVLAMDQLGHLIASRLKRGRLVTEPDEIADALQSGRVPVLAPYRWLRRVDPLPRSWDVTSDSIAAWVAGSIGARRLVLVKPPGARGAGLVDAHFEGTLPANVAVTMLGADQVMDLRQILGARAEPARTS